MATLNESASPSRILEGFTLEQTRLDLIPLLFGSYASWILLAFIFAQTHTYYGRSRSSPDARYIQITVYSLVFIQACQTALDSLTAYRELVFYWGDLNAGADVTMSVSDNFLLLSDALAGAVVQYFYIRRIWTFAVAMFDTRMKIITACLCIFVAALPPISWGSVLAFFIIVTPATSDNDRVQRTIGTLLPVFVISTAVADVAITGFMIFILYHAKSVAYHEETRDRFSRVLHATIQTGFVTAILAILVAVLILGESVRVHGLYTLPLFCLGKSYVISFLSILNARVRQRSTEHAYKPGMQPTTEHPSITMQCIPARGTLTDLDIRPSRRGFAAYLRSFTDAIRHQVTRVFAMTGVESHPSAA